MSKVLLAFTALALAFAPSTRAADVPDGWKAFAVREEIAPASSVVGDNGAYALRLEGKGNAAVDGRWQRRVPVAGGKYYLFHAEYQAERVATPARSVLARVVWFDGRGKQVEQPEFPLTAPQAGADGWRLLTGTYQAPAKAAEAQLELHLRWAPDGRVLFRNAELKETSPPSPRKVRLAAIHHRPRKSASPQANLESFATLIEQAGAQKADVVCLGEGITVVGTQLKYADVAEPIPGPSTDRLGKSAAAAKVYVVAGLYERDGKTIYNTSVLIGRDGKLAGKYRKVCLPREEIDGGITPGSDYPVFDTDFGRVGMMICWDVHFPEVARELSARGAEVILMPIWGGNETLAKARAIENQIHLVASGYDFPTVIYDRKGETVAKGEKDPSVILTEVDLNDRTLWPWLGDWRSRIWREGPARAAEPASDPRAGEPAARGH
jgi:predicted amidohydrolase